MDRIYAQCDDLRVQIWEPGQKEVLITSSLDELIEDGEYSLARKSGVSIMFVLFLAASPT